MTYSRRAVVFVVWAPCLLLAAHPTVGAIELSLAKSLPAPGNNLVQLRRIDMNEGQAEPQADLGKYISSAEAKGYSVALKSIEHYGANQYFIYEFLAWRSGDKRRTRILVNVTSTGSFSDFFKDVPFTIEDGPRKASGNINIPIHSLDPLPLCKAVNLPTKTSPLQVDLGENTEYTVSLDCNAAVALPRLISLGQAARPHREYWKDVAFKSKYYGPDGPSRSVSTKSFDLLYLTLTPNVLAAAGARFRRLRVKD